MITCYDTVSWDQIPANAEMVAGYIDGKYAWPQQAWDKFAHVPSLRIVVNPRNNAGDVYDCEPGNGSPEDAGPWAKMRNAAGVEHPCIYCSRNEWWTRIKQSVANAGATGVVYWVAEWNGQPHEIPGAVGTQYADPKFAIAGGKNVDVSVFFDTSWINGSSPNPAPPPVLPSGNPFPLPADNWYSVPSADNRNHSGYFWPSDRPAISKIQNFLGISADGKFGPETFSHVVGYQRMRGIGVDGKVGPTTWRNMFA